MAKRSILIFAWLMCSCASVPDNPQIPPVQSNLGRTPTAPATIIGYSVRGRPMELYSFGQGSRPVLVMAAIHGDEPTSVEISRGLLHELQRDPRVVAGV